MNPTSVYFYVYAKQGTTLLKNEKRFFHFNAKTKFTRVTLKADDYLSISSNDAIELENINSFPITVKIKDSEGNVLETFKIEAKEKISHIGLKDASSKLFVEEDDEPIKERELLFEADEEKPYVEPADKFGTPKADQIIYFEAHIDAKVLKIENIPIIPFVDVPYVREEQKFSLDLHQKRPTFMHFYMGWPFTSRRTKSKIYLKGSKDHYIDHFTLDPPGILELKNTNSFPVTVKTIEEDEFPVFTDILPQEKYSFFLGKDSKLFAKRKTNPEVTGIPTEQGPGFSLEFFAEKGIFLHRNNQPYFLFEPPGLSGVKAKLQSNDTISIGKDEDIKNDPSVGEPTEVSTLAAEERAKKRRLIVRNRNRFFIIVKTVTPHAQKFYTIGARSESFIFFGKEDHQVFMLKGVEEKTKKLPRLQEHSIIIYVSVADFTKGNKTLKLNGKEISGTAFITLRDGAHTDLADLTGAFEFSKEFVFSMDLSGNEEFRTSIILASDPSNRNLFVQRFIKGQLSKEKLVIRPGGVIEWELILNADERQFKWKVKNRLITALKVYELDSFLIPFQSIPRLKREPSLKYVDVLNTSLYELILGIQKERKFQGETEDCNLLTKLLYSTLLISEKIPGMEIPYSGLMPNSAGASAAWMLAILLTYTKGVDKIIITLLVLAKKFKDLAKYMALHEMLKNFAQQLMDTDFYRSQVIDLLNKQYNTYLFELGIQDNSGFILCMYSATKEADFWKDPWGFIADLPNYMGKEL